MTDYTIDPDTGLPVLPEGLYFHVDTYSVEIRRKLPDFPWVSHLYEWSRVFVFYKWEKREVGIWPFKRVEYRVTDAVERVASAKTPPDHGTHPLISPENLLETAVRALTNYREKIAHRELLGDYPPKKFGA